MLESGSGLQGCVWWARQMLLLCTLYCLNH